MGFSIPWNFVRIIGFRVWKDLRLWSKSGATSHLHKVCDYCCPIDLIEYLDWSQESLLHYLAQRYSYKDTHTVRLTLPDSLWILGLTLGYGLSAPHLN